MSLLTVEDVNGVVFREGIESYFHEIDTGLISDSADFTDVKYDFCKVSRSTSGSDITYTFKVENSAWQGQYYFKKNNNDYIDSNATYNSSTHVISFTTTLNSVKLVLYCTHLSTSFIFNRMLYSVDNPISELLTLDGFNKIYYNVISHNLKTGSTLNGQIVLGDPGIYNWRVSNEYYYYLARLQKTDFQFTPTETLTIGKVNKVALGTDTKYKPSGALIGDYTPDIKIIYNNETITPEYDTDDYYFNLDLTDKTEPSKIKFTVIIENNEVLNYSETDVTLESDYELITTLSDLTTALGTNGNNIIKLGADITLTGNVTIRHDVKIIGNDKTFGCTNGRLWVNTGSHVIIEDCTFTNGKTCILQLPGTTVELTNCTFTENQGYAGYNYSNNKGSCIFCRNRYENFEDETDFTTILKDCLFINNHSAILHGGQLTIDNCRFHNTDLTYVDEDNPAFLYMTDGEANITNSVFDLDYTETTLCTNEKNIGYAQSLITCGENAIINGKGHGELQTDNSLPFFDAPYNNRSHLFVKYYYPQISECVYSSPLLNYEDKSCCHSVSGVDWVFKDNVQITRASWGTENTDRKIRW